MIYRASEIKQRSSVRGHSADHQQFTQNVTFHNKIYFKRLKKLKILYNALSEMKGEDSLEL